MPTVTLNKKTIEKLIGRSMPIEKLKDRICYIGTAFEKLEGNNMQIEVFPNRPDMLSEQGFARALSTFIGAKKGIKKYDVKKSGEKVIIDKSVSDIRPYTACAIVKKLKFDDEKIREVIQIQEKLHITYGRNRKKIAIGIYPFEKITPPIRFVAKDPKEIKFRPLEADRIMNGLQILSSNPTGREYAHLLEGKKKFPLFIDSKGNVLSMPPIINSHDVGKITEKTKEVFIECSGFDFNALSRCLNIIVTALADMGGEICSMELDYPGKKRVTPNLAPLKVKVDVRYINHVLGLDLNKAKIKSCLEKMGFGYSNGYALVPAYRADIMHQRDLAEDIAIAYGYDNLKEEIPKVATIGQEDSFNVFCKQISDILVGLGLIEIKNYCLIDKDIQTKRCNFVQDVVELIDPVSAEYNSLRYWLIPCALLTLKNNKHNEYPQSIFEYGSVFKKDKKEYTGVKESARLCVMLCHPKTDFTEAKQMIDYLFRMLDIKYSVKDVSHSSFIEGRVGRVYVGDAAVAYLGEIHPAVLENFGIESPVSCFELNLTELFKEIK